MKPSIFIFLLAFSFVSVVAQKSDLPYPVQYSSNFKVGSHDLSKMVLDLYKDYEANDFTSKESWFADTLMVIMPDGSVTKGKSEGIDIFKKSRASEENVKFSFDAIIPLMSVDRKENWVALWGSEELNEAANPTNKMKMDFQAIWRINKGKKIDFIRIYNAKAMQQQQ